MYDCMCVSMWIRGNLDQVRDIEQQIATGAMRQKEDAEVDHEEARDDGGGWFECPLCACVYTYLFERVCCAERRRWKRR